MRGLLSGILLLLLCLSPAPCRAQEPAQLELMLKNCKAAYDQVSNENRALKSKGYEAQLGYVEYFYGDYARKRAEIELGTFMWQARASEILIWVVVIVCLSGVAFSGYQLWKATAPGPAPSDAAAKSPNSARAAAVTSGATDIELSWQSVRITSSVIGLVVLVISIVYLYLFLKEVYDIKVAGPLEASASSTTAASTSGAPVSGPK